MRYVDAFINSIKEEFVYIHVHSMSTGSAVYYTEGIKKMLLRIFDNSFATQHATLQLMRNYSTPWSIKSNHLFSTITLASLGRFL